MKKFLSIAIPTYNMEKYLSNCLDSIICESINLIEIIIVNDGSKDNSLEIAKDYERRYPNSIIVIDKENGGHGSTINAALKVASGKYFKVLDSDDLLETSNLDSFVNYLTETNDDIILSNYKTFDDITGKSLKEFTQNGIQENITYAVKDIYDTFYHVMANETFKTSLIKNINIQEKCFYVDCEFDNFSIANCSSISYFNKLIYKYRLGRIGQSVSIEGSYKHRKDHEKVVKRLIEFCEECSINKNQNLDLIKKNVLQLTYINYLKFAVVYRKHHEVKQEIIEFDKYLMAHEELYKASNNYKIIKSLRKHKFNNIWFISMLFVTNNILKKLKIKK